MNIIVYTENIMKKPLSLKVDDEQLQVDVYFFFLFKLCITILVSTIISYNVYFFTKFARVYL